jgi:two-component system, LytTR family, response regulator
MTAIIVDDEKHCREVIQHLLQKYCAEITVVASCASGNEALLYIEKVSPDILFLDIEMPGMNGFELIEKIPHPGFEIIFTTAYNEYAIKAIKHSALDYLLKPVDKDELIQAVQRAKSHQSILAAQRVNNLVQLLNAKNNKRFAVPSSEGLIMVDTDNIVYCESDSAYCKIFFNNNPKPLLISKTLKEVEDVLSPTDFCRIHNSYLINLKAVQRYIRGEGGEVVLNNGQHLPVSRTRKQDFLSLLEKI